jgi:CheY-like chemotaxis protein
MSERILVVDDDERIAAIVRDGLLRLGYRVELAADGPTALAVVGNRALELTAWESGLLECLMQQAGQVLMRSALLEQVWGSDVEGESNVVAGLATGILGRANAHRHAQPVHGQYLTHDDGLPQPRPRADDVPDGGWLGGPRVRGPRWPPDHGPPQ